jgi:hypothetical protein
MGFLDLGRQLAEASTMALTRVMTMAPSGYAQALAGRHREGLATLEEAVAEGESITVLFFHTLWIAWQSEILAAIGRLDR